MHVLQVAAQPQDRVKNIWLQASTGPRVTLWLSPRQTRMEDIVVALAVDCVGLTGEWWSEETWRGTLTLQVWRDIVSVDWLSSLTTAHLNPQLQTG